MNWNSSFFVSVGVEAYSYVLRFLRSRKARRLVIGVLDLVTASDADEDGAVAVLRGSVGAGDPARPAPVNPQEVRAAAQIEQKGSKRAAPVRAEPEDSWICDDRAALAIA